MRPSCVCLYTSVVMTSDKAEETAVHSGQIKDYLSRCLCKEVPPIKITHWWLQNQPNPAFI